MNARRVVLTRTREQSRAWERALKAGGVDVLLLPLIRYVALPVSDPNVAAGFDWILFTSPHAASAFVEAGLRAGQARIGALGEATAAALAAAGLPAHLDAKAADGSGLAREFCERVAAPVSVLLPGAARRLPDPAAALRRAGHNVVELALYRTEEVPASELPHDPFRSDDIVFFASPSAVDAFVAAYDRRPSCAAIGETTALAARRHGFNPRVAARPNLAGLCRAAGLEVHDLQEESWT